MPNGTAVATIKIFYKINPLLPAQSLVNLCVPLQHLRACKYATATATGTTSRHPLVESPTTRYPTLNLNMNLQHKT